MADYLLLRGTDEYLLLRATADNLLLRGVGMEESVPGMEYRANSARFDWSADGRTHWKATGNDMTWTAEET